MFSTQASTDIPNVRYVDLGTNNRVVLTRKDPYGFWFVSYERGATPATLSGAYTTFSDAERAVAQYLTTQGKVIKNIT